jgi:SAM-dependent methyltransferase
MSVADWEKRYETGEMPWEKGSGAPGLEDFLEGHPELPRGTVLVPGCGTGHDVLTWARFGFTVTGLDVAPSAIRLSRQRLEAAARAAQLEQGDFLRDNPGVRFDWVFEHTLYCAIDPLERDLYVQAMMRWLKPGGQLLAIHYMIDERDGPPFGCTQAELVRRFSPGFELLEGWVPRSYPNRLNLELMLWWQRRASLAETGNSAA